jgi:rhodanese-related sulfurtransferase
VTERVDVNQIDVDSLDRQRAEGAPIIDVRQPFEYDEAHVPGARLMPMDELPELIDEIPLDEPVYVICQTGVRSQRVSEWLLRQGYDANNVAGGTQAWIESGKPIVSGREPG